MEIEAKFAVPDIGTFQKLQAAEHVTGFSLSAHQVQQVHDTYLDTDERLILVSGYACRCRETEAELLITLKGLGRAEGAIHRRRELEISLAGYEPPEDWPESPVRDLVLDMTRGVRPKPLFELQQTRVFRRLSQGELLVAQLSLDNVRIIDGERQRSHFELEVELAPQGTASDMRAIVTYLQDAWNLIPEQTSKFERGLMFLDEDSPVGLILTAQERAICAQIAKRKDLYGMRAQGLLLLDAGVAPDRVASQADRTPRTVRRWQSAFEVQRLGVFPARALREVQSTPAAILPGVPRPEREAADSDVDSTPQPEPQPIQALFRRYLVDQAHTQSVAEHALALFDALKSFHGLSDERRSFMETAAVLHNIGTDPGLNRQAPQGRDILLQYPPQGLDEEERLMVALTTYLHPGTIASEALSAKLNEEPFDRLSERARKDALTLSALARMADGLDYSQTQSSRLGEIEETGDRVDIEVSGPYAAIDAGRAQEKSDLWHLLSDARVRFAPEGVSLDLTPYSREDDTGDGVSLAPQELPERPGLAAEDSMGQAGRKILAFQFQHMLYHEPGTRAGEDIEELHDMRVATRRIRAAFRVFSDYLDMNELKPVRKGARRTCSRLGTVRDLDVFWARTRSYAETLPPGRQDDLMPLRELWEAEREEAREELLTYLDSDRYVRFKKQTASLLQLGDVWESPVLTRKGEAVPHRLRHVVPVTIYDRAAALLAYDEWIMKGNASLKRLHRLRIAGKRLRYTLEFFEEVLAPQTADLINQMKRLQDHLGDLQDAVVASELLRDFLAWGTWGHARKQKEAGRSREAVVAPGVAAYLADKQDELQEMLRGFPEAWSYFQTPEFKQTLALVLAPL